MYTNKRGGGLFVVLFIATAIAFGIYSVYDLLRGQIYVTKKAEVYNQAVQSLESLLQSGVIDLHDRIERGGALTPAALFPTNQPLSVSNEFLSKYDDLMPYNSSSSDSGDQRSGLIRPSVTQYTSLMEIGTENTEIVGLVVSPKSFQTIDPNELGNEEDADAGDSFQKSSVRIVGKTTMRHSVFGDVTVYGTQVLELREIPLFTHAIYYNLPMEIAPGPDMDVYGKVHVNGDAYFQSGNNKSLNFHGRVTVAGDVFHGRHPDSGMGESAGMVQFSDHAGDLISMRSDASWSDAAIDLFPGGWLESALKEGEEGDPVNIELYKQLTDMLWDSNLLTKHHGVGTVRLPGVVDYTEDNDPTTPGKQALNSSYVIIEPVVNEIESASASATQAEQDTIKALQTAEKTKFAYNAGLTIEISDSGEPSYYIYERNVDNQIVFNDDGSPKKVMLEPQDDAVIDNTSVIFDKREGHNMKLINLDVGKLKDMVDSNTAAMWAQNDGDEESIGTTGNDSNAPEKPENWWTGTVYVKFPQQLSESNREDNVNPAKDNGWALRLINGQTIPNPAFARSKNLYGTTIATNQAMYVQGHYNSDGALDTGSSTSPDDSWEFNRENQEAPAALAADAITFLSSNWDDANSAKGSGERIAGPTEVSAAILTGLVPSGKHGSPNYSGGVENFPRFLENWGGKEFVMRGSIVAMFESEVATEPWGKSDVYSAPRRNWGYHSNYNNTPPPGPRIMKYRARNLGVISEEEYVTFISNNYGNSTSY